MSIRVHFRQLHLLREMLSERVELLQRIALGAEIWQRENVRDGVASGPPPTPEELLILYTVHLSLQSSNAPPPITPTALSNLKTVVVARQHVQNKRAHCAICISNLRVGTQGTQLPCEHIFCPPCITQWLQQSRTCPICRTEVVDAEPKPRREKPRSSVETLDDDEIAAMDDMWRRANPPRPPPPSPPHFDLVLARRAEPPVQWDRPSPPTPPPASAVPIRREHNSTSRLRTLVERERPTNEPTTRGTSRVEPTPPPARRSSSQRMNYTEDTDDLYRFSSVLQNRRYR